MSSTRKRLVARLDQIFSKYIRERDGHCVTCGSRDNLQCGHLFSRVTYSTRWNETNGATQCSKCNLIHEYDPYPLTNYFLLNYGKDAYDELHATYKAPSRYSDSMLEEMIKYYGEKYEQQRKM